MGDSEFAQIIPLAAAAGTPIPGIHESPHWYRLCTGVELPGNVEPLDADIAGPYDPLCRRKKNSCVSGVPSSSTFVLCRMSGMKRSSADHKHYTRCSLSSSYSGDPRFMPSHKLYGSFPAVYAWTTPLPTGAKVGSNMVGTDAMQTF